MAIGTRDVAKARPCGSSSSTPPRSTSSLHPLRAVHGFVTSRKLPQPSFDGRSRDVAEYTLPESVVRGMEEKAIMELCTLLISVLATCFQFPLVIDTGSISTLHFRKHFVTRRITESSHLRAPTLPRRRVHTRRRRPRRPLPLALTRGRPPALKVSSRGEC